MRTIPIRLTAILICLFYASVPAQDMAPLAWKFQKGDDPAWADPSFNDRDWEAIQTGILWEEQGHAGYDGYGWYRATVVIPSSLRAKAQKQRGFILKLGKIDDVDETWFNGEKIGSTGGFPPVYETRYDAEREYAVTPVRIRWDKPNVIAVRVYDSGGGGGLYGTPAVLTMRGFADLFKLGVALKNPDHVFMDHGHFTIPVSLRNASDETLEGRIRVQVTTDFGDLIVDHAESVKSRRHSDRLVPFTIPDLLPGFYLASAAFESSLYTTIHKFAFAVEPERVISLPDAPEDFTDFWARAKWELAAVDPQFVMIQKDSLCTQTRDVYLVEMRSLGNVLVRGWYSRPRKEGCYPAILHVQGYGTNMQPAWMVQDEDFVSFGLNVRGHGNSRWDVNPGFPGYLQDHLHDAECYIYRGAYMDCLRALDFLFIRPEVDQTRIVVEGGSQGGALSFATAALAPDRIRLCVPGVPFLSDFKHYFKLAVWPGNEFAQYVEKTPGMTWDRVFHTLSYFDIKNLAPRVQAPVLMSVGLLDDVCPPRINFAAFNNLSSRREYVVYPYSGHSLPGENHAYRMAWIRRQLGMK
ncbi:alpha/beta fold hydrolase [bacterium]|nr:alpha/beta fold hydrolase [bacterium]